jgi:hypothetical protein
MENRAGVFKSQLYGELAYQSFLPSPLPPSPPLVIDDEMTQLLVRAPDFRTFKDLKLKKPAK